MHGLLPTAGTSSSPPQRLCNVSSSKSAPQEPSQTRGGRKRLDVQTVDPHDCYDDCELVLAVDEALQRLAEEEESVAEVVRLRCFAGMSVERMAVAPNLSVRTVNRHWAYTRAWLYQELKPEGDDEN
jgi:DNA-directed RNA polymerase specialized sigma24 family protein